MRRVPEEEEHMKGWLTGWDIDKFLDRYVRIRDLDGVKDRHHKSVYDFNVNNRSFEGGEDAFLFQRDDFISARKTPGSMKSNRVEDMIESYLQNNPKSRLHVSIADIFHSPNLNLKVDTYNIRVYSTTLTLCKI